jgi:ComF family protein
MELARKLLSSLFPSRCILCRQTVVEAVTGQHIEICLPCYQALPKNDRTCSRCALPLPDDIDGNVLCGRCVNKRPLYDYSRSLFLYEDDVISLIHQLKFGEKIGYARSIGEMLLSVVNDDLLPEQGRPDCIIPVPLHNKRLRARGYNQSTEISRVMAKKLAIPIAYDAVVRTRHTKAQMDLKAKDRQKNIKGAFSVIDVKKFSHVLIIDDVVTTGSTVNELAKMLKDKGVERVGVLSVARAPLKN